MMAIGGVQRHQNRIERETVDAVQQHGGVVVPGDAEEAYGSLLPRLLERLDGAVLAEDALQLNGRAHVVELPQIEVVGL